MLESRLAELSRRVEETAAALEEPADGARSAERGRRCTARARLRAVSVPRVGSKEASRAHVLPDRSARPRPAPRPPRTAPLPWRRRGRPAVPHQPLHRPRRTQATGLRVDLPTPDCAARPSDCADVTVLEHARRLQHPAANLDPVQTARSTCSSVSKKTCSSSGRGGRVVGPNQLVWEPAANTLHFESDRQLERGRPPICSCSRAARASRRHRLERPTSARGLRPRPRDTADEGLRKALLDALPMAMAGGANPTTSPRRACSRPSRSARSRARSARSCRGGEANFLARHGRRAHGLPAVVRQRDHLAAAGHDDARRSPPAGSVLPLLAGVGTVGFGTYVSPDYETPGKVIPPVGTTTGNPVATGHEPGAVLRLPARGRPAAGGWPVAIFGHGFTDWKNGAPPAVAGTFARNGIAMVAINVVGHGGGALGHVHRRARRPPPVTLPLGGRGIDQDGNGTIDSTEGVNAAPPNTLVGNRDGLRQTTIDLMQLVKVLQGGVDVDGDGGRRPELVADLLRRPVVRRHLRHAAARARAATSEPASRTCPADRSSRSRGSRRASASSSGLSLLRRMPPLYNAIPNAGLEQLPREHPAPESAAGDRDAGRNRDPAS